MTTEQPKVQLGDIYVSAWGYDQTNIDFYQVVALTASGKTVTLRQLAKTHVDAEHVLPEPDAFFNGELLRHRVNKRGTIAVKSFAAAWRWEGKPMYQTPWGYGH